MPSVPLCKERPVFSFKMIRLLQIYIHTGHDRGAWHAVSGDTIFYRFYADEEIRRDPEKAYTGLFFFRGRRGAPFAVCNAGGGFMYVGAMHDSFPHALALSRMG